MDVYLRGKRIKLDPTRSLGKGGEADVFDLGDGRALKLCKTPDHPDYQGLPVEQKAAEQRIALHQKQAPRLPRGTPPASDRSRGARHRPLRPRRRRLRHAGRRPRRAAAPLRRTGFRRAGVRQPRRRQALRELHAAVIRPPRGRGRDRRLQRSQRPGDHRRAPRFIDADSFQFGAYPCRVFTERFVDPLLCDRQGTDPSPLPPLRRGLRLVRLRGDGDADPALRGALRRRLPAQGRLAPHVRGARPLHRITVFHPEVLYPKPATRYGVLPDDLLHHLHLVFEKDRARPFPRRAARRASAGRAARSARVEHARAVCPVCAPRRRPRKAAPCYGARRGRLHARLRHRR